MAIVHFVNYKKGTQSRAAMRGVMLYVMQEKKTAWDGVPLVSGVNCQPQSVYDDFLNTKLLYHKDGGVMFYHMVQSFPKGAAVDPQQAHEAARRLAEYFDGCEVLVCTHVDREHIHSHCVINSVNFETGKKLHMAKEQLQELMRRNDMICQEMGLPVFDAPTQQARGMSGAEYHTALKGQSWKLRLANTIDDCMRYAADKDAFVSLMASEGYAVRWESGRKYITYTTPDGLTCRNNKLHEEKYCKEAMEHEFRIRAKLVQRKFHRAAETDGGIEADESAEQRAAANSAAGAGTTTRSESHESGLGANDERSGYTVVPCGSADGSVGAHQQADVAASHTDATGRSAEDGAASGADDRTGWETEREFFFSAQNQTSQTASATSQYSGIDLSADGGGSTASALVGLGYRLEQLQPAEPVIPARHYTDRKVLQKEREKKIALGHKTDDHEDEVSYDWQQTM